MKFGAKRLSYNIMCKELFILLPFHDVITIMDMKGLDLRVWLYLFLGAMHVLRINIRNINPISYNHFQPSQ